jgi:glycosyltransferase involved in cell wall biosynthesis
MSRPRALVVTPRMPWPLDDGGRIGLWQALWSVSRAAETMLVTLLTPQEMDLPVPEEVKSVCVAIERVTHQPPLLPVAALRGLLGRWPYTIARYRSNALDAVLRRRVATFRPDFVYVNHLSMASYADAFEGTPVVLREHNLEYLWLERYAAGLREPLSRLYATDQARRMRRVEADLCRRCDLVLAMQDLETEALRRLEPRARVETVPVGVDFSRFSAPAPEQPPVVLLTGAFVWPPNVEGALAFFATGWPRVRARVPGARLRVVGKGFTPSLAEAARSAGAEPVGYVESMIPEFARATAMVVPLWVGAGARVKIVEALAARLAVVSTPLGAEGLGLVPGRHMLEGGTPEELGDALAELLLDPGRVAAMATAGHEFARDRFSLELVAERTNLLIADAIADRGRNRG